MATNEIKFKSDVSVLGNFNVDSFSISRLETANLPALTTDGSVAYDTIKQSLIVYDLNNTEWKISNGSILQEDNLSIRPQGQVQFSDGNPRGSNSVDLQTVRDAVDQVAGGDYDVISGGKNNKTDSVNAWATSNTIGGGEDNTIVASYVSTIGGGQGNVLSTEAGVIGGGSYNEIYAGWQNSIFSGQNNYIGNEGDNHEGNYIASGNFNTIAFLQNGSGDYNSICGGGSDNAINFGDYNTLGGGRNNIIKRSADLNNELPSYNTMPGGHDNEIFDGDYNTILGGRNNAVTGSYSVAFGRRAVTVNESVVLFADETTNVFSDVAANSFNIQASGGLRLVDGNEGVGKVLTCDANGTGHWNPRGVDSITVGEGLSIDNADAQVPIITLTGGAVVSQETAPTSPSEGDLWFDTVEGLLYVYYDDGNDSPQWVSSSTGSVGPQGEDGAVGATGPQGEDGAVGATGPNGNIDGVGDSVTGTATFTNSDNNINLTGIGNLGGLTEAGDVIQVTGSTGNNKLYTVEFRTDANNIIVNEAHAADDSWDTVPYSELDEVIESGRTYRCLIAHTGAVFATDLAAGRWLLVEYEGDKRLAAENTGTQTITLVCKAKNAPLGYGQGWVGVRVDRGGGTFGVITTNSIGRSISVAVSVETNTVTTNNEPAFAQVYVDGRKVTRAGVDDTQTGLNRMTPVDFIVPPGSKYSVLASEPGGVNDLSITQWVELR